jgi:predicted nucleotidyltransferase
MDGTQRDAASFWAGRTEARLKEMACSHLIGATVILFGSRAKGDAHRRSDFDIAYMPATGFDPTSVVRLREAIEESEVFYAVDLVDLSRVEPGFREKVLSEGVVWRSQARRIAP